MLLEGAPLADDHASATNVKSIACAPLESRVQTYELGGGAFTMIAHYTKLAEKLQLRLPPTAGFMGRNGRGRWEVPTEMQRSGQLAFEGRSSPKVLSRFSLCWRK